MHGGPIRPRHGREQSQHLLDDTVQVLEGHDGVQPQLSFGAQAAVDEEAPVPQLLPQALQDSRVAEELHDEGGAGAGGGGKGSKDQFNGRLLRDNGEVGWCISAFVYSESSHCPDWPLEVLNLREGTMV